jgi:hypothetical protein
MRTESQYVPYSAQDIWAMLSATARELRSCGLIVPSSLRSKAGLFTAAASSKMLPECCQEPKKKQSQLPLSLSGGLHEIGVVEKCGGVGVGDGVVGVELDMP